MQWHRGMFFWVSDRESSVHYRSGNGDDREKLDTQHLHGCPFIVAHIFLLLDGLG